MKNLIARAGAVLCLIAVATTPVAGDGGVEDPFSSPERTGLNETLLISRASGADGVKGNGTSEAPSVSADGRFVAFFSGATNLHPDDADNIRDVFVRDRDTNETLLASRASGPDGIKGNANSQSPSISADGRYVVFESQATNLHPDDIDSVLDVYLRDLQTHETILVSRADGPDGAKSNGASDRVSISANGRFVAFSSQATNLHPDDTDSTRDIYVRDLHTDVTILVSRASGGDGAKANRAAFDPVLSADGRFVVFHSQADNLHPDADVANRFNVFVRDLQTEQTLLVSRASGATGAVGNGHSRGGSITADGRFLAFRSVATNLDPDAADTLNDIYVRDLLTHETILVSRATGAAGVKGNGHSQDESISADGRYVAYRSQASNLHPDDNDTTQDVYVRELHTHDTILISRASGPDGAKGNGNSNQPAITADGRYIAFQSRASNLHPEATDLNFDIFLRDVLGPPEPSMGHKTVLASRASGSDGVKGNDFSWPRSVSADGRYVAFTSQASNLHPDDPGGGLFGEDVYVRDTWTNETILVSRASGIDGAKGNGQSTDPSISADGRFVAFGSNATNLHPDDTDGAPDVFVRDLVTHETLLVSRASGAAGAKGNRPSWSPWISADGRHIAFETASSNLHPDATDTITDIFVRDLETHETILVSRQSLPNGTKGNGSSTNPALSADGRFVAFTSLANNLHPDGFDTLPDVYVRDLHLHETILVSRASGAGGVKGNSRSEYPSLSADGRHISFVSSASNLHPDDPDSHRDVFVRNLETHETVLVSRAGGADGAKGDLPSGGLAEWQRPSISGDGRYVAFSSEATNLHPDDTDSLEDVFLRDLQRHEIHLVSRASGPSGAKGDNHSGASWITADGRHVAFGSNATNLHPDDTDIIGDVYLRDVLGPPDFTVSPELLDFGSVAVGDAGGPLSVTLVNTGVDGLAVQAIATPDAPFVQAGGSCDAPPFVLAPDQGCTLDYTFVPLVSGLAEASVSIDSGSDASPHAFALRGIGLGSLNIAPDTLDFGDIVVGEIGGPRSVTLTNQSEDDVTVAEVADPDPPFLLAGGNCAAPPFILAPEAKCTLEYTFGPVVEGSASAAVVIDHDAPGDTVVLTLQGNGVPVPPAVIEVTPGDFDITLPLGASVKETLHIGNLGGESLMWAIYTAGSVTAADQSHFRAAIPGGGALDCDGEPGIIIHDDGTIENGYGGNPVVHGEVTFADRFTPSAYPTVLRAVCVAFRTQGPSSMDFEIVVFDDTGPGGSPGTLLGAMPATAIDIPSGGTPEPGWQGYDISSLGIAIHAGTVYIGARWIPSNPNVFLAADQSPGNPSGFAGGYLRAGGSGAWSPIVDAFPQYRALFVRAVAGCSDLAVIPWIDVSPATGSTPGGGSSEVEVGFDSNGLIPGEHRATLCIQSNDPARPFLSVPITLTVPIPPDFAIIEGTVLGLGHCGAGSAPLVDSEIVVAGQAQSYTVFSDSNGFYRLALDAAEGPVDLTVSVPSHVSQTVAKIEIEAGATMVQDFELVLEAPCVSVDPDAFAVELPEGTGATVELTIGNMLGGAELEWSIDTAQPPTVSTRGGLAVGSHGGPSSPAEGGAGRDTGSELAAATTLVSSEGWSDQPLVDPNMAIVDCDGEPGIIVHDDGSIERGYSANPDLVNQVAFADRFTPSGYPARLRAVCVAFWTLGSTFLDFEIVVFDDDGPDGSPGTELGALTASVANIPFPTSSMPRWNSYDVSPLGVTIDSGSVYIGVRWTPSNPNVFITADESPDNPVGFGGGQRWTDFTNSWVAIETAHPEYRALFIRAVIDPSGCTGPSNIEWLSVDTAAGSIPVAGSDAVGVTIDSSHLLPGDYAASLCVESNDPVNTLTVVPLTLVVTPAPVLTFDSAALHFGDVEVGTVSAQELVALQNTGSAHANNLSFSHLDDNFDADVSACGDTLEPGGDCQVGVTFTPSTSGPAHAELQVTSAEGVSAALGLDGNGIDMPAPKLIFTPPSLDFGEVEVGSDGSHQTVALANTGGGDATGLTFTGLPDYGFQADTGDCGNILPAGGSCDVVVTFAPAELGSAEAVLLVVSDGDVSADLNLSGVGIVDSGPPDNPIFDDRFEQATR